MLIKKFSRVAIFKIFSFLLVKYMSKVLLIFQNFSSNITNLMRDRFYKI